MSKTVMDPLPNLCREKAAYCQPYLVRQVNSVYARNGLNHARHFNASRYILPQLEARFFKVTLENKLDS